MDEDGQSEVVCSIFFLRRYALIVCAPLLVMDFSQILATGGASASMIAIVGIAIKLFQSFCGHRVRSECCNHEASMGIVVEQMPKREPRPSVEVKIHPSPVIAPAAAPAGPPPVAL